MADALNFFYGTEAQILALTPTSENWIDKAFYYPSDKNYFYQVVNGEMKKYGTGIGITLNGSVLGGIKNLIEDNDLLNIPENYEYNAFKLGVQGRIICKGKINIM